MNKLEETKEKFYNNKVVVIIVLAAAVIIGASQLFQSIGASVDTYHNLTEKQDAPVAPKYRKVLIGSVLTKMGVPLTNYQLKVFPKNYHSLTRAAEYFTLVYTSPVDSLYLDIEAADHVAQKHRISMIQARGDTLYRQFHLQAAPTEVLTDEIIPTTKRPQATPQARTPSAIDLSNATVNGPIINQPTGNIVIESNYGATPADTTRKN